MFAGLVFNWDVNFGTVVAAGALLLSLWQSHRKTRDQQERMHRQNQGEISGLKTQVAAIQATMGIILTWAQAQWGKASGGD